MFQIIDLCLQFVDSSVFVFDYSHKFGNASVRGCILLFYLVERLAQFFLEIF